VIELRRELSRLKSMMLVHRDCPISRQQLQQQQQQQQQAAITGISVVQGSYRPWKVLALKC